jgi:integrase
MQLGDTTPQPADPAYAGVETRAIRGSSLIIMTILPDLRPVPWGRFADEVLRLYAPPMRRRGTRDKTRQVLREFGAHCPTTAELTELAIADWIAAHAHRAAATVDGLLRHLSAICTYGAHRGYLRDPFDFRTVSSWLPEDELDAEPFRRHRTAEEVRRVLALADDEARLGPWEARRLRAAVYLLAYTGAGKAEVLGLRMADLDPAAATLSIRSHTRRRLKRGARAAVLPLAPPAAEALAGWLPEVLARFPGCAFAFPHKRGDGPWLQGRPGHRPLDQVRALGERAGVAGLTIVAFRHTTATLLEAAGVSELIIQRILRHARRETQLWYRNPDLPAMREAVGRLRF